MLNGDLQVSQRQHHKLHHQLERRHGLQRPHTQTPVRREEKRGALLFLSSFVFLTRSVFILLQARPGGVQQSEEVQPDSQPPERLQRGGAETGRDQTVGPGR